MVLGGALGVFWGIVRAFLGSRQECVAWGIFGWVLREMGNGFCGFLEHLCCREWLRVHCGQELCGGLEEGKLWLWGWEEILGQL